MLSRWILVREALLLAGPHPELVQGELVISSMDFDGTQIELILRIDPTAALPSVLTFSVGLWEGCGNFPG